MRIAPETDCERCGKQIGNDDYLLATDGVAKKIVAFHIKCDPRTADLQRHFKINLAGPTFGLSPKDVR